MMPARPFFAAAFALSFSALPASASYTALTAFGDSLSDVGNLYDYTYALSGGAAAVPAPPYSEGRFSNGPLWVQDISQSLGLGAVTPSIVGGNDYAWGGATTGYSGTLDPSAPVPTLETQVGQFLLANGGSASSGALYTFSIGANDLIGILSNPSLTPAEVAADVAGAAEAVASAAASLSLAGAKDLLLFEVPDLGVTPLIQDLGVPGLPEAATLLSLAFDGLVQMDIASAAPGLKVYAIDTVALIDNAVNDPHAFGFTNVTDPCWTGDKSGYGGGGTLCSTNVAEQDKYLFWDDLHPTEAGHLLVAEAGLQVLGVPESSTWVMMLAGFGGIGLLAARRPRKGRGVVLNLNRV